MKPSFRTFILFLGLTLAGCGQAPEHNLISSDLNGQELQERIWLLKDSGDMDQAAELQKKVADVLANGNCNQIKKKNLGGMSAPKFLECDHGIEAVFKMKRFANPYEEPTAEKGEMKKSFIYDAQPLSDANSEVGAFKIDQLLDLRIVPVTVLRTLPHLGRGSMQYFVKGAGAGGGDINTPGYRKMKIMDFIINNEDRWKGNWLHRSNSNRIFAIDNGRSFDKKDPEKHLDNPIISLEEVVEYLEFELELRERILAVSEKQVFNALKKVMTSAHIDWVNGRLNEIKNAVRSR